MATVATAIGTHFRWFDRKQVNPDVVQSPVTVLLMRVLSDVISSGPAYQSEDAGNDHRN